MKHLKLRRMLQSPQTIRGVLEIDGYLFCYTLENADLSVPSGSYGLGWRLSPSKGRYLYEVKDVPFRSGVLIHIGNTHVDTTGCILLGMAIGQMGEVPGILQSRIAINLFHEVMNTEDARITIEEMT